MKNSFLNKDYKNWLVDFKNQIRNNQLKSMLLVNSALMNFYWEIGKMISESSEAYLDQREKKEQVWGNKLIEQVSLDLKEEFPDLKGFSKRNLIYCRNFYNVYDNQIGQQLVAQIQSTDIQENSVVQQPVAQLQTIDNQENIFEQRAVAQIPLFNKLFFAQQF